MGQYKYLICVSAKDLETGEDKNNNKFYEMKENEDGTFTATYGRIGNGIQTKTYPISKWDSVYKQKTQKVRNGYIYKDITDLKSTVTSGSFKDVSDPKIHKFLETLNNYSKQSILDNYTVEASSVTQQQVDEAQKYVNNLAKFAIRKGQISIIDINDNLLELFQVIPRKMKRVKDHLVSKGITKKELQKIVANEQDTLDVMSQQASMIQTSDDKELTIEDALGVKLEHIDDNDKEQILKLMEKNSHQFTTAYKVINIHTQPKFDKQKEKSFKHWTKLLWHGSRNENWLNILKIGLLIRPSCAVQTGAMFGNGIYFANKCQKSIGYTSLRGSYWASGSKDQAFLALFDVNTGMELREQRHQSWMYNLDERKLKSKGDYDSFYAQGGADLINDEFIIYNQNQCTIKYIVEIN